MVKQSNGESVPGTDDRGRCELAGDAAHDFINIVAGILCHLSLLRQSPELPEGAKEMLKEIESEAIRAANIARYLQPDGPRPESAAIHDGEAPANRTALSRNQSLEAGGCTGSETILLVDDNISLRRMAALCLRKLGYAVLEAGNAPGARAHWETRRNDIRLLVTDVVMPQGLTGLELAQQLRKEMPELKVIITSGYNAQPVQADLRQPGVTFLPKPYDAATLARCVRKSLVGT